MYLSSKMSKSHPVLLDQKSRLVITLFPAPVHIQAPSPSTIHLSVSPLLYRVRHRFEKSQLVQSDPVHRLTTSQPGSKPFVYPKHAFAHAA
jgi:hypothetical protein